jgi:hypothetical protein
MNEQVEEQATRGAPEVQVILPPEGPQYGVVEQRMVDEAQSMVIDSPFMADIAAASLKEITNSIKAREEERLIMVRPVLAAVANINNRFKRRTDLLETVRKIYGAKLAGWVRLLEDQRREEQRKREEAAREEARKREADAAALRAKAAAEAAELQRKADAAREAGNVASATKLESRAEGKLETAEAKAEVIEAEAAAIPSAVVVAAVQKPKGISIPKSYSGECEDLAKLVDFVAANKGFLHLLQCHQVNLNAHARSTKDTFQVPGCKLVKTDKVSVR